MLHTGQPAPGFSLPDSDMEYFDFESLRGHQHVVLFFYPRDGTPLCAQEAIDFSDHEEEFKRLGCQIIGVSRDDFLSHADFRDRFGLSVRLLSDVEGEVCRKYGVCQMREKDGHRKLCVIRSTFIIDRDGIIRHAFYGITPKGHAATVYQLVKELNGSGKHSCKSKKTLSSH
ncbi:peroxiredoxin [Denitratisoma oestradiolicum]|uniref:thioredoxin-dependent peroxiredoxin n=1 Tax=Denitratisoma oestradiolicum TaxID=311182 RepID=A0A6S6XYR3_9PROT|nr:peroxiredoxin [Denitratisoma oestradiolicum]TWO80217.1 peroxiredoxin [Denitratisoma oestradiolicum]CAB1369301.1 Peroxiredoxin [Denitratisoma oestradiolicum]